MPSETFFCPHCKRQLTKSAPAYVLGEAISDKDARFVLPDGMAQWVTCPGCGAAIDAKKMILGEYDGSIARGGGVGCVGFVAVFGLILMGEQPWWVALIGGIAAGCLAEAIWNKVRAK